MAVEIKVPAVGESITEVYIGAWRVSEGDEVDQDQDVVELETEKATFDVPAPARGVISKILKRDGDRAAIGEVIAHLDESGGRPGARREKAAVAETSAERGAREPERGRAERAAPRKEEGREAPAPRRAEPHVMPAAARALAEHGLSAGEVEATGPGGRLLKEDVLRHAERKPPAEAPPPRPGPRDGREEETVPMSPIRRRIAQRLVQAQQTAALLTTFNEVDMSGVKALRSRYQEAFQKKYGVKLGFMSFFVKASIDALQAFPDINAEVRGNDIVYRNYYDIGIAIGGGRGLVVPVLRGAERLSFAEIELAIADFARRARDNALEPHELQGGTFTISNGGVYGSLLSTPIVNPPQSGVLGMHAVQDRPVVVGGEIAVRPMMYVALSYDHRIVDGREAVTFLRRIKEAVEEPARLLLEV